APAGDQRLGGRLGIAGLQGGGHVLARQPLGQGPGLGRHRGGGGLDRLVPRLLQLAKPLLALPRPRPAPAEPRRQQRQQRRQHKRAPAGLRQRRSTRVLSVHPRPLVQRTPVWPKPPSPRALAANVSTTFSSARTIGANTSWAMRSPGSMVNASRPRFQMLISSGPW